MVGSAGRHPRGGDHPQLYDIVDCTFEGNELWLADDVPPDTLLTMSAADGTLLVRRRPAR